MTADSLEKKILKKRLEKFAISAKSYYIWYLLSIDYCDKYFSEIKNFKKKAHNILIIKLND